MQQAESLGEIGVEDDIGSRKDQIRDFVVIQQVHFDSDWRARRT